MDARHAEGAPSRRSAVIAAAALVTLVALVHGRTCLAGGSFVFDDFRFIVRNPAVTSPPSSLSAWTAFLTDPATTDPHSPQGIVRPLRTLEFALDARLFGIDAPAFHLHSLAWFAAGAMMVLLVLRELLGDLRAAFVGAAVWALHPMQTEAADWISSRGDLASGALVLGSVLAALRSRGRDRALVVSLVLAALAMLYKESAVVVPGLVVITRMLRPSRPASLGRTVLAAWPWLAVSIAYLAWREHVQVGTTAHVTTYVLGGSTLGTLATMCRGFGAYVLFALLPVRPAVDWYLDPSQGFGAAEVAWLAVHAGAVVWALRGLARRRPAAAAVAWFYAALVPVANWPFYLGIPTAERFLHVALVGLALGVGLAFRAASRAGRSAWGAATVVVVALGTTSFLRAADWKDDASLWTSTSRVVESPRAEGFLAAEGRRDGVAALRAAQATAPGPVRTRAEAAAKATLEEALGHAHRALLAWARIEGTVRSTTYVVGEPHVNASNLCFLLGRPGEALFHAEEAIRIEPDGAPHAHYDRALALLDLHRGTAALRSTQRALALGLAADDEARWMLERASALCEEDGETEMARAALQAAIDAHVPGAERVRAKLDALVARVDARIAALRAARDAAAPGEVHGRASTALAMALAYDGRTADADAVRASISGPRGEPWTAGDDWVLARWLARGTPEDLRTAHDVLLLYVMEPPRPAPDPWVLGRVAEEAGNDAEALAAFTRFLDAHPEPRVPGDARVARAQAAVDRLRRPCPALFPEPPAAR